MSKLKRVFTIIMCILLTLPMCLVSKPNNVYADDRPLETIVASGTSSTVGSNPIYTTYKVKNLSIADITEIAATISVNSQEGHGGKSKARSVTVSLYDGDDNLLGSATSKAVRGANTTATLTVTDDMKAMVTKEPCYYTCEWTSYHRFTATNDGGSCNITTKASLLSTTITQYKHIHEHTSTVTIPVTCTTDGETTWTCSCGDSYTTPIPAPGHTFQTLIINSQKVAERCIKCGFFGSGNLTHFKISDF